MVWAGARLGKGRAALGPEGGSPVSTRAQCLKRSSISGTTPRQPRQPLCGCSFYSSSLQSHGYLAHFMIGDTYSRSHCRTGIETQVCQPHSLRQSPPSQCPPQAPGEGSSVSGLEAHKWLFLQGRVHPEGGVTITGTRAGFQPCHRGARLQLVCQSAQGGSLSAQAGHGHVQWATTRARPRPCAARPQLAWPAPTCSLPQ